MTSLNSGRLQSFALPLVLVAAVWCAAPAPAQPFASGRVGELGRREAIVLEGNSTFSTSEILLMLEWQLDFYLAAHRLAPLQEYTAFLERKITLGYQRAGFPEVSVKATANHNAHRIVVQVKEGPRLRCGEVFLTGATSMTNATVLQAIRNMLLGKNLKPEPANMIPVLWVSNAPAPLDPGSQRTLKLAVQGVLAGLNYFQPTISVEIQPDSKRNLADLRVEIADEGIKGTIERIVVSGTRTNTPQTVMDYLKLRPGMDLQAGLVNSVINELRNSGRFLHHDVRLGSQPQAGNFELQLDLEELRGASPLDHGPSAPEQAMLRLENWLRGWQERPEDLVWSIGCSNSSTRIEAVRSAAGFALVTRKALSSNGPPALIYALVASRQDFGVYSVWRQKKFVCKLTGAEARVFLAICPDPTMPSTFPFTVSMNASLWSKPETPEPFRLELDVPPVFFMHAANRRDSKGTPKRRRRVADHLYRKRMVAFSDPGRDWQIAPIDLHASRPGTFFPGNAS